MGGETDFDDPTFGFVIDCSVGHEEVGVYAA